LDDILPLWIDFSHCETISFFMNIGHPWQYIV